MELEVLVLGDVGRVGWCCPAPACGGAETMVVGWAGNADVVLSTGGDPGLRAAVTVGRVMHQPIVRHDALPVALVPEPVGMAMAKFMLRLTWTRSATLR